MERGTVKWFDKEKGYGFILSDIGKKEYFVHESALLDLERTLDKGHIVEFEIGKGQKSPAAVNVQILFEHEE